MTGWVLAPRARADIESIYRPAEPGVEIVRILHGSMDVDRHL